MSEKKKSTSSNDIAVRNSNLTVATTVNSTFKKKKVNVLDEETFLTVCYLITCLKIEIEFKNEFYFLRN